MLNGSVRRLGRHDGTSFGTAVALCLVELSRRDSRGQFGQSKESYASYTHVLWNSSVALLGRHDCTSCGTAVGLYLVELSGRAARGQFGQSKDSYASYTHVLWNSSVALLGLALIYISEPTGLLSIQYAVYCMTIHYL